MGVGVCCDLLTDEHMKCGEEVGVSDELECDEVVIFETGDRFSSYVIWM